jgi:polyferredoxin
LDFVGVDENETELINIDYQIPSKYVVGADFDLEESGLQPIKYVLGGLVRESKLTDWQRAWVGQAFNIFVLVMLLVVVSAVLVFKHVIVRRRQLYRWVRLSILAVVLVWLGWIAGAQLSIVNVFAYAQAIAGRLEWSTLLFEPLIVILVVYTALSLILLGRGVFCGWLCPFGAFQELLSQLARFARVPQLTPSFTLNEGLWAVKYLVVIGLAAVSVLWSMELGLLGAEVEPFKTAITLKFERPWPYAVYAILLLVVGLFMERFFCRFLCPLGGVLAFLGRFRLFQWLKRRPECGAPCHICEVSCPVQAIEPSGTINMNECFQCLDCQVDYYDDRRCPPLVFLRKKNEPTTIFFPKPLAAK